MNDIKTETNLFLDDVTLKTGNSNGKPYRFYSLKFSATDGRTLYVSTENEIWKGKVRTGGHNIQFTEKQNGKYTNRYMVEGMISSEKRPPEVKAAQTTDDFRNELRESLDAIHMKLDILLANNKPTKSNTVPPPEALPF